MRRSHLVPLSTQALDLLNELKIMTGNSRYVFPGRNDPSKPMREAAINQPAFTRSVSRSRPR